MTRMREAYAASAENGNKSFDELYGDQADSLFESETNIVDPRFSKLFERVYKDANNPNYKALRESCNLGEGINDCAHNKPGFEGSDPEVTQSEHNYDVTPKGTEGASASKPGVQKFTESKGYEDTYDALGQDWKPFEKIIDQIEEDLDEEGCLFILRDLDESKYSVINLIEDIRGGTPGEVIYESLIDAGMEPPDAETLLQTADRYANQNLTESSIVNNDLFDKILKEAKEKKCDCGKDDCPECSKAKKAKKKVKESIEDFEADAVTPQDEFENRMDSLDDLDDDADLYDDEESFSKAEDLEDPDSFVDEEDWDDYEDMAEEGEDLGTDVDDIEDEFYDKEGNWDPIESDDDFIDEYDDYEDD